MRLNFSIVRALLALSLTVPLLARDWQVPVTSPGLDITLEGTVEINRSSVETIRPGSPSAVVSWIGPDGKHAAFGDVLMRLDTTGIRQTHDQQSQALAVLLEQQAAERASQVSLLAIEEETLNVQLEDLRVRAAAARSFDKADTNRIATLAREVILAQQQATLQDAELERLNALFALGEVSAIEVEDATLVTEAAWRAVRIAELELKDAGDGSDEVAARRAAWMLERVRTSMGVDESGEVNETRGIGKTVSSLRKRIDRMNERQAQEREASELELQATARAAWPHVPIRKLRLLKGDDVLYELTSTNQDAQATYEAARGFGWVAPPMTAPDRGAITIRGKAQWRCDAPPGTYTLEVVLGDEVEWGCISLRQGGRPLVAINRLTPKQIETRRIDVTVGSDGFVLDVGREEKVILASAAGAVKNQSWLSLGREIRENPPALYLTPKAELLVQLRVHQLQVPFFEDSELVDNRIELRDSHGVWIPGGAVTINSDPAPFFPSKERSGYGDQSSESPDEKTAREVNVAVPSEHGSGFAFASHVPCRVTAQPKPGVVAIPIYLVHEGKDGLQVQRGSTLLPIQGVRFDQHVLVREGIVPGEILVPPKPKTETEAGNRFTGEVVAGQATPINMAIRSWARIESLMEHGSKVKKGDLIMTLYRPEETARAVKAKAKATGAEGRFLAAADTQQAEFLKETGLQAQALQEEKLAADRVRENRRIDASILASAEESKRATDAQLAVLETRVAELQGKEAARLAYEEYRRERDILRLQAQQQAMSTVATFRQTDYTQKLEDRLLWHRARQELSVREGKLALTIRQQDVTSQQALSQLQNGLEARNDNSDFESQRFVLAPADGHVFFQQGYNDLTKRRERMAREFVVWGGLTVAEILDVDNLLFDLRLPERFYNAIQMDMELPIELEDLGDRLLIGRVVKKGRVLYTPTRHLDRAPQAIGLHRQFDITLSFAVPSDLKDILRPGIRGSVQMP